MQEHLIVSDYEAYETRPSLIDPGKTHQVFLGMRCPRCKTILEPLKHGVPRACDKCQLKMVAWGNGLYCSTDHRWPKADWEE